jgi:hypothetical protein
LRLLVDGHVVSEAGMVVGTRLEINIGTSNVDTRLYSEVLGMDTASHCSGLH